MALFASIEFDCKQKGVLEENGNAYIRTVAITSYCELKSCNIAIIIFAKIIIELMLNLQGLMRY